MIFLQAGHCNQDQDFKVDIKIPKERERGLVIS
jgi:endonuclease I